MKKVYLDNAATTVVYKEVLDVMLPFFTDKYGNASCLHSWGEESRDALEEARVVIAKKINAGADEIIFTAGGSESNNFALKGVAYLLKSKGNHIITSKFEHPAVLNVCKALEKDGFNITYIGIDRDGFVKIDELKKAITDKTILVSIMHANNEIGTIQDILAVGKICKEKNIVFHSDVVQSFTKVPIDVKKSNLSLASLSAHKIHGPKGIGALYVKKGIKLKKLIDGGAQEFNLRAGTENVPGAVGFAKACELIASKDIDKMEGLRDYFIAEVIKQIPKVSLNGSGRDRLCNNISLSFHNVEGESVLLALNDKGIAVTTSSACTSSKLEASHVLSSIGLRPEQSHGTVRFSLSKYTTKEELEYTIAVLKEIISKFRGMSPLK